MRVSTNGCFAALAAAALILGPSPQFARWLDVDRGWKASMDMRQASRRPCRPMGRLSVGYSSRGDYEVDQQRQAVRWTESARAVGLGFLPGHAWSEARDVSADGSVVVGYSQVDIGQHTAGEAFRWTQDGAMTSLGFLPGHELSWAAGVSADGSVVVGTSGGWTGHAFRWTQTGGMVDLGGPAGSSWSRAQAVSADGSVVVGDWGTETITGDGFRWTEADGMVSLGSGGINYMHDVSADGSVVVGESFALGAVSWTEASGLVALGDLSEFPSSRAMGVSQDGSLIVGVYSPPTTGGLSAFLWDATNGMRDLTELLIADGVDLAPDRLQSANDVSFDGQRTVIIGEGYNPNALGGFAAWVAVVPEPSTFSLLTVGFLGLAASAWRRRRK